MRPSVLLLLLGSLLAGLGFICVLPPFEGFDETAHYSTIAQIWQTHTWPRINDPISAEVERYLERAPGALSLHSRWSYPEFFAAGRETVAAGQAVLDAPRPDAQWHPGKGNNWEGQHPPLYYTLLAPLYGLSSDWSLKAQLILLRSVSYALAWLGLLLLALDNRSDTSRAEAGYFAAGAALWPALFPMWFPEMARLGNDSLVVFFVAAAVIVIRRVVRDDAPGAYLGLGVIFGLGLLTKATMLPLWAATGFCLAVRLLVMRRVTLQGALMRLSACAGATLAIAGWWYARNIIETGTPLAANEETLLAQAGGFTHALAGKFLLPDFIRGLLVSLRTFFWGGTWSYIQPPRLAKLVLLLPAAVILAGSILYWRRVKPSLLDAIAVLTVILFLAALVHRILLYIAVSGFFEVGTWYVHVLAPVMCGLVGFGLPQMLRRRMLAPAAITAMGYPLLFLAFVVIMQAVYFAGCGETETNSPYFDVTTLTACSIGTLRENLSVLTYPLAATLFFAMGWIAMAGGTIWAGLQLRGPASPSLDISAPDDTPAGSHVA